MMLEKKPSLFAVTGISSFLLQTFYCEPTGIFLRAEIPWPADITVLLPTPVTKDALMASHVEMQKAVHYTLYHGGNYFTLFNLTSNFTTKHCNRQQLLLNEFLPLQRWCVDVTTVVPNGKRIHFCPALPLFPLWKFQPDIYLRPIFSYLDPLEWKTNIDLAFLFPV